MMKVASLRRARRHALLNHAQLRILYQMPSITITTTAPDVMLGGRFADWADVHKVITASATQRSLPAPSSPIPSSPSANLSTPRPSAADRAAETPDDR